MEDRVRDLETTLGEKRGRRDRVRESAVREMGLETTLGENRSER